MRVTGGTLRGRTLLAPEGLGTRPTTDRVREALFNVLAHHDWGSRHPDPLEGTIVLDAFAGTGALGIEALSRGASQSYFFEKSPNALKNLNKNISTLSLADRTKVFPVDVTRPLRAPCPCTLIFLDPPYRQNLIPLALNALSASGWIDANALIVTETDRKESLSLPETYQNLLFRDYGDTRLGVFAASPDAA